MDLKDNVRYRREREGYSQLELAKRLGVSQQMIAGIESGMRLANHKLIIGMTLVFDCTADELLGLDKTA